MVGILRAVAAGSIAYLRCEDVADAQPRLVARHGHTGERVELLAHAAEAWAAQDGGEEAFAAVVNLDADGAVVALEGAKAGAVAGLHAGGIKMNFRDAARSDGALCERALSLHEVAGDGGGAQAQPALAIGERPHALDRQVVPLPDRGEESLAVGQQRLRQGLLVGGRGVEVVGCPDVAAVLVFTQRGGEGLQRLAESR